MATKLPNDSAWRDFVLQYANKEPFWYVAKPGSYADLPKIRQRLAILKKFRGKLWSTAQRDYVRELRKKGLFEPRARGRQSESDKSAIGRMIKVLFDTLGLAWVDEEDAVFISSVGEAFLISPRPGKVLERQLLKYQLWNPSIPSKYRDVRLFPYVFILQVLLRLPDGITPEEYNLFVCRAEEEDHLSDVCARINAWRKTDDGTRESVLSSLKGARMSSSKSRERVSRYLQISRCQTYAWTLFTSPNDLLVIEEGRLRIRPTRVAKARLTVRQHADSAAFIDFLDSKEWFSYYGDATLGNSDLTALKVYEERYDIDRALEAFAGAKRKGLLPRALNQYRFLHTLIKEKILEDVLEYNLSLIDPGLRLHSEPGARGRQFQTERGRIDLLARDRKGDWVVIELKRGMAGDKVVGQTLRYIDWVEGNRARGHQMVRGVIVGALVDRNLLAAARAAHRIQLYEFNFQLTVLSRLPSRRNARSLDTAAS